MYFWLYLATPWFDSSRSTIEPSILINLKDRNGHMSSLIFPNTRIYMKPVSLCQKSQERPPIHGKNSRCRPPDLKMFQHRGNSGLGPLGPIGNNIEKYDSYCQFLSKLFLAKIEFKSLCWTLKIAMDRSRQKRPWWYKPFWLQTSQAPRGGLRFRS